jgi:hypothetical protein
MVGRMLPKLNQCGVYSSADRFSLAKHENPVADGSPNLKVYGLSKERK